MVTDGHATLGAPISAYKQHALDACSVSKTTLEGKPGKDWPDIPMRCLDLSYAYALLTEGYHRDPKDDLVMAQSIDANGKDIETQWCLGAALAGMA